MIRVNGVSFSNIEDALEVGHTIEEMVHDYNGESRHYDEIDMKLQLIPTDKRVQRAIDKSYHKWLSK